jgi:hypothetical protein
MVIHRAGHVRIALVVALVVAPGRVEAQRRVSLSPGIALGEALGQRAAGTTPIGSGWTRGRHAMLTLDVAAVNLPVRLRAELMAVSQRQAHGPVSLGASVVVPIGASQLRPYALAGAGVYGVGSVGHPVGWTAGVGAEYRRQSATLFLEARRHSQIPSAVSVGLRF